MRGKAWELLSLGWRRRRLRLGLAFQNFLPGKSNVFPTMAVDDSNLYSRTKNKLNSSQNDYKSSRRSSLPPELLIGNDIKARFQRNFRNLEPIHLRRPKKRPSIFPGRICFNWCLPVKTTRIVFHFKRSDVLHFRLLGTCLRTWGSKVNMFNCKKKKKKFFSSESTPILFLFLIYFHIFKGL